MDHYWATTADRPDPNQYTREEGPGPDRWRCPGHLADVARRALAEADAG